MTPHFLVEVEMLRDKFAILDDEELLVIVPYAVLGEVHGATYVNLTIEQPRLDVHR